MKSSPAWWLYWTPRISGVLFAVFISIFSLDILGTGRNFWDKLAGFFLHSLPIILLLLAALLSRRWGWLSGTLFLAWSIFYLLRLGGFNFLIYLILSGVPALIGVLFLVDYRYRTKLPST